MILNVNGTIGQIANSEAVTATTPGVQMQVRNQPQGTSSGFAMFTHIVNGTSSNIATGLPAMFVLCVGYNVNTNATAASISALTVT
jgi:hypothetical protein